MDVAVQITQYTVSALPESHMEADIFAITVEYRGADRWAVLRGTRCLAADGTWDFEPNPSSRTKEWRDSHRFDEQTALRLAREAAPKVAVNGWTAERVLAEA